MQFYRDTNGIVWSILNETTTDLEATFKRHIKQLGSGKVHQSKLYPILLNNQPYMVFINIKGRVHYYKEVKLNIYGNVSSQLVHYRQNNNKEQIKIGILNQMERAEILKLAVQHNQELRAEGIMCG